MTRELIDADLLEVEYAVRVIFRQARNPRVQDLLREKAGVDLDRASYGVLIRVGEYSPLRLSTLAGHVGVDVSTVSRQVQKLEREGLVVRTPDPDDRRAVSLSLSAEGRRVGERLREAWVDMLAEVLIDFTPEEIRVFTGRLSRFADALRGLTDEE